MHLGPFDGRKKRSRCKACSASHLKCSGDQPCTACKRKNVACTYNFASSGAGKIRVGSGAHQTIINFTTTTTTNRSTVVVRPAEHIKPALTVRPIIDSETYMFFFDEFSRRNNLSGQLGNTFADHIKALPSIGDKPYLLDAMTAIGAMEASKSTQTEDTKRQWYCYSGVSSYVNSVASLRESLVDTTEPMSSDCRTNVLWTTFLLGLFELLNEATGDGWLQHMIHGTAKGIQAAGPTLCETETGRKFFQQARIFEVCRTIVYNAPTFLTEQKWMDVSRNLWKVDEAAEVWTPLDSLLDIMVMCSSLRVRVEDLLDTAHVNNFAQDPPKDAHRAAADGVYLREALQVWQETYGRTIADGKRAVEDESVLLGQIFFAAISIYLSGIFDYEEMHWQRFGITITSNLDAQCIKKYVDSIIRLVDSALTCSTISPLLFLFPLRVAGARAIEIQDCATIRQLLENIGRRFTVASAIALSLDELWLYRGILTRV